MKHDVTPIFKSQNTIASLLPPVKDKQDKLLAKGIYHTPCECGKAYTGETGRSVRTRVKEQERYIRLKQLNMSVIAENAIELNHKIALEDTKVLVRENSFWARKNSESLTETLATTFCDSPVLVANRKKYATKISG